MAIFSRQKNTDEAEKKDVVATDEVAATETATEEAAPQFVLNIGASQTLVVPRLSEKAGSLGALNKYVFTIHGKLNKVELRKAIEKQYGVKIATVNMIVMQGKMRRFGSRMGRASSYKKAIVTLTKDSKKIDLVEPS